eukprot:1459578-Pyramimonas_sp.AAC.1
MSPGVLVKTHATSRADHRAGADDLGQQVPERNCHYVNHAPRLRRAGCQTTTRPLFFRCCSHYDYCSMASDAQK